MTAGCVIVGGGHGGFHTANALSEAGYDAPITIVDAGEGLPYERPPLSKAYLAGSLDRDGLAFRPVDFYDGAGITVHSGTRAVAIERSLRVLQLEGPDGARRGVPYDHLVLATGSRPRALRVPGGELAGVHRLATTSDADALGAALDAARRVVVIGAGFIGLECAAVATERGLEVTVINLASRALDRAASAPLAEFVCGWHEQRGVTFHHDTGVAEIVGLGAVGTAGVGSGAAGIGAARAGAAAGARVISVLDTAGRTHPADLVVAGIGAEPVTELAEAAGLEVDGGIMVDEHLRTSDEHIFAVGDCARFPHGLLGERMRLESVQNATDHARGVAASLTGSPSPYAAVPWFWSDQGDLKVQIAGLTSGADEHVVRGDPNSGRFSIFSYRGGRLAGVDSVRRAGDHVQARRLLAAGITPTPEQAADPNFPLKSLQAASENAA